MPNTQMSFRGADRKYWGSARKGAFRSNWMTSAALNAANALIYYPLSTTYNMMRSREEVPFSAYKRKRAHSAQWSDAGLSGISGISKSQGPVTVVKDKDTSVVGMRHGRHWVNNYIDNRTRVEKMIEPCTQVTTTQFQTTNPVCDAGVQALIPYNMWSKADLATLINQWVSLMTSSNGATSTNTTYTALGTQTTIATTDCDTPLAIPLMQFKFMWHNSGNTNCYFTIYEYVCRRDCNQGPGSFWNEAINDPSNMGIGATEETVWAATADSFQPIGGSAFGDLDQADEIGSSNVGARPQGKALRQHWKLTAKVKGMIPTGKNLEYIINAPSKSINKSTLDNSSSTYMEGWSVSMLLVIHGEFLTSDNAAQLNLISTSDVSLRCYLEGNMAFHGRQPVTMKRIRLSDATYSADGALPNFANADQNVFNETTENPDAAGFVADT